MFRRSSGFTLIEILVVVAIIAILTATVTVYALRGSTASRDAKRQADLKLLQAAVEAYKVDNGRYPPGCNAVGNWSGEVGTAFECTTSPTDKRYIIGLAPKYIRSLPQDPNRGNCKDTTAPLDCGYAYITNAEGSVYKIVAMNTVESDTVTPSHSMASCDYTGGSSNDIRREQGGDGWCGALYEGTVLVQTEADVNHRCNPNSTRFKSSYAVWGGFADIRGTPAYTGESGCISSTACVNPSPVDPAADPLDSFMNSSGVPVTSASISASNRNALRVRAVLGTAEIICK